MKIINQKMNGRQFINYIENLKIRRKVNKLVFHHTSSSVDSWHGSGSMLHYWNLYRSRGWKYGPNLFIAKDGIWLFSPLNKQGRGAPGEGSRKSIHIEVVGRYFDCPPDNKEICYNIALVSYLLMVKFDLGPDDLHNHFEYDPYAHETRYINGEWVAELVFRYKKTIEKAIKDNDNFDSCWRLFKSQPKSKFFKKF